MSIAVLPAIGSLQSGTATSRIARVEVLSDLAAAEPAWRRLEREGALLTPYQRFDFLAPWQRHVGESEGMRPFIVVGFGAEGDPLFLWPFGQQRRGPTRVVEFLGGKHANFNFALWRRELAASISASDMRGILDRVAPRRHGIDLFTLLRQPVTWNGVNNPFRLWRHRESADECSRMTVSGTGDEIINTQLSATMRGRLRTKERKLQKLPGYRYFRASTREEAARLLETFFELKTAHMAAQGLPNVFSEPGVQPFLREACARDIIGETPLIEFHLLEGDGELLAFFAAITDGERFSLMFNTYTLGEHGRHSPGLILLVHVVRQCADRGFKTFDLGVGEAGYKAFFCKEPEPLFDTFMPVSPLGWLTAHATSSVQDFKRRIKRNTTLWSAVQAVRRRVGGKTNG